MKIYETTFYLKVEEWVKQRWPEARVVPCSGRDCVKTHVEIEFFDQEYGPESPKLEFVDGSGYYVGTEWLEDDDENVVYFQLLSEALDRVAEIVSAQVMGILRKNMATVEMSPEEVFRRLKA